MKYKALVRLFSSLSVSAQPFTLTHDLKFRPNSVIFQPALTIAQGYLQNNKALFLLAPQFVSSVTSCKGKSISLLVNNSVQSPRLLNLILGYNFLADTIGKGKWGDVAKGIKRLVSLSLCRMQVVFFQDFSSLPFFYTIPALINKSSC